LKTQTKVNSAGLQKYIEELVKQTSTANNFFNFEMDKLGQGEKILRKQLVDCQELFQNIPFYFQKQESFIRE